MPVRIPHRGYLVYAHDIIMTVISFYASIYLRLGERFDTFFTTETLLLAGGLFGLIAAGGGRGVRMIKHKPAEAGK